MEQHGKHVPYLVVATILLALCAVFVWKTSRPPLVVTDDTTNATGNETRTDIPPEPQTPEQHSIVSAPFTDNTIVITADFDTANDTVTFTHPDTGTVTLPLAISGSGVRYAAPGESIVLWEHQDEVTITVNGVEIFRGGREVTSTAPQSETEARAIAEQSCIKGGEALSAGTYNEVTKTWWFDANLNATREGCNPACVVNVETRTAEVNWRCTGLVPPSVEPAPVTCGIENCHGLDIVCGPNPAEMCTMMYQLGDKCRQYATCGVVDGVCQPIESPEFANCKSCVRKCEQDFPDEADKAFACESACGM